MYKSILVAIDLGHGEKGEAMISKAAELVDEGGEVILLSVIEEPPSYIASELPANIFARKLEEAEDRLDSIAARHDAKTRKIVQSGRNAAAAILDAAEDNSCDLIMIASHRPGISDFFLGSTAGRVVRHAQTSVLVQR